MEAPVIIKYIRSFVQGADIRHLTSALSFVDVKLPRANHSKNKKNTWRKHVYKNACFETKADF